ncbi:MAG: YidH family protein [Xanthobacteraceae bacterium]
MAASKTIERSSEKLADSAKEMEHSTKRVEDSADRRTQLAADRTVLAAERTYAAWVRTGLVALASGIGAQKLLGGIIPQWMVATTGSLLVLFAAFCFVAGVWRQVDPGAPPPEPNTRRLPPWVLLILNGFLAVVAAAVLTGLWFGRAVE